MAAALQLSFVDDSGALQVLELDAFLSEQHQHTAKVTQFPVETGAVISDHVIQEPDVVRLEVFTTDTPTPSGVRLDPDTMRQLAEAKEYVGRAAILYRQVVELKEAGRAVILTTTVHTYEGMVIESVELPADAGVGDAARFSVTMRHVETVGLRTVPAPKIDPAKPKVSKGMQPTKPVERPNSRMKDRAIQLGATKP